MSNKNRLLDDDEDDYSDVAQDLEQGLEELTNSFN